MLFVASSPVLANSVYDGIWYRKYFNAYYSVTINDGKFAIIALNEVASFQDPAKGVYLGTTSVDLAKPYPNAILEAYGRILTPRKAEPMNFDTIEVFFFSSNSAVIGLPTRDYPNLDLIPPSPFVKVF